LHSQLFVTTFTVVCHNFHSVSNEIDFYTYNKRKNGGKAEIAEDHGTTSLY